MDSNDRTILIEPNQTDHWSIPHVLFFFISALLGTTWRDTLLMVGAWKALEATPWLDIAVAPDALIVDPLEALYGWLAVCFLRRYGSPGYAVAALESRSWSWWRVALIAYLPLFAQTMGALGMASTDGPRMLIGIREHYIWGASFTWALAVVMVSAPRQWPGRLAWGTWAYMTIYYAAQLAAYNRGYNGWFLATWLHLGLIVVSVWYVIFASRPQSPDYTSEA